MDLYQLRYFLETSRALNFSRAAESLGVSPSAISRSIGMLETSIGRHLFARTKRRVSLTVAGETLKRRAERVFDEIEHARAELSGTAPALEQLKIGSREMIINYLLPEPLRAFQTRFPTARVGLYELSPAAMAQAVKTERLDLGFHYLHLMDAALETFRLGTLPSHVYASKAYLKKHGRPADLRALLKHPFIAPRAWEEDPTAPRADGFPDHTHPRTVRYETELLETHLRFVLSGLCVGVLPDFIAKGKAVALPGPDISRTIYCFKRAGRSLHPAAAELIESVKTRIRLTGGI